MADVDNSVGAIYQRRSTRSGSDAADKVSPGIKDAMDRIFPKSPSNFLQNPFPDNHDVRRGGSNVPSAKSSVSRVLSVSQPLACTVSNALITTDTTTTATAVFTGLSISASGTKSPIMSSVAAYSSDIPSLPAPAIVQNADSLQNGTISVPSQPKTLSKARISRADLHMCIQTMGESPASTISSELMTEKKQKKRRKKYRQMETDHNKTTEDSTNNIDCHPLTNGDASASDGSLLYRSPVKVQQKLPKVLRHYIKVDKDAKYIRKKFLPCYVVLKKASVDSSAEDLDFSLLDRVKHLSELCAKNMIDCSKFKSLHYRNIFEECVIPNSEEEFVSPRGRSLRKRNQHVSYVEPSEDDLLEDFGSLSKRKKGQNKPAAENEHSHTDSTDCAEGKAADEDSKGKDKMDKKSNMKKVERDNVHQKNTTEVDSSKTGTANTGMKDDKGRNMVYVYPKTTVANSAGKSIGISSEKKTPKKRIGPASKTNQPLNLSTSSLTTLSLPRSLLAGNITVRSMTNVTSSQPAMPPIIQPPLSSTSTTGGPQFYMVKLDGKDYLVPIMAGPNALRPGLPGAATHPLLRGVLAPTTSAHPLNVPRMSSVMIPGMPMTSGVRMLTPPLSTPNILSSVPLVGEPQVTPSFLPVNNLSQIGFGSNRPSQLIPTSIMASTIARPTNSTAITSLVSTTITTSTAIMSAALQSILSTKNVTTSSLVAPLAAPASTTVLRSTRPRVVTAGSSIMTPNASATGNRCFRIIVPSCSSGGVTARIATLGAQANSSPLTHLALSSSLLPQRKRSIEKEISPEKQAAKRRRLEKKYPLPPGVVIKTEPDEVPKTTNSILQAGSMRSLLSQNIQLITSTARGGSTTLPNVRLLAPISGSRQMRLSSNIVIRTPINSTGLSASASSIILNPSTQGNSSASVVSNSTTVPSLTTTSNSITTMAVTGLTTTTGSNLHSTNSASPPNSSDKITTLSYSAPTNSSTSPSSSFKSQIRAKVYSLKIRIENLRKLITTQEKAGLKGPRLDKLKEVLVQKEKVLSALEIEKTQAESEQSQLFGVSPADPVVID